MNAPSISQSWDYFRTVYGIGLRTIAAIPADKLDSRPIPNMRTPKELAVHMVSLIGMLTNGVASGQVEDGEKTEPQTVSRLTTLPDLLAWARTSWNEADRTAQTLTEAQLAATVKTPWGQDFPGIVLMGIAYNEVWHHRGQLYTYLRALGVEPPMLYDYEGNEPAFQPAATQKV